MLFSKFLERGGSRLIDAQSVIHEYATDITLDVDGGDNVYVLKPSAEAVVTVPNPTSTRPTRYLIANDGEFSSTVIANGVEYEIIVDEMYFLEWTGSVFVITGGDVLDQVQTFMEYKILSGDSADYDNFGKSVSISSDGTRCIIGAHGDNTNTGGTDSGSVYIYFWNGTTWIEEQKIQSSDIDQYDWFGAAVSISSDGTRCIVGAYGEDMGGGNAGTAYIFSRSGTTWTEEQKIISSDILSNDLFGYSVSISNDGTRCIVGAWGEDTGGSNAGAAYIFSRTGTVWTEEQKLLASDGLVDDYFGASVFMSGDGTRCIVGARRDGKTFQYGGAAYIFSRSGTTWTEEQKIISSDLDLGDSFGGSVSISSDGSRCLVGAYGDDTGDINNGAAYIFSRSGTTWTEEQKILSGEDGVSVLFGASVTISGDGTQCIVGAYGDADGGSNAGAVYIFTRTGTAWSLGRKIITSDADVDDMSGHSTSISSDGTRYISGAYGEDTGGLNAGAVYIYHNTQGDI